MWKEGRPLLINQFFEVLSTISCAEIVSVLTGPNPLGASPKGVREFCRAQAARTVGRPPAPAAQPWRSAFAVECFWDDRICRISGKLVLKLEGAYQSLSELSVKVC